MTQISFAKPPTETAQQQQNIDTQNDDFSAHNFKL